MSCNPQIWFPHIKYQSFKNIYFTANRHILDILMTILYILIGIICIGAFMIGTCMRFSKPEKGLEYTDWGLHFCSNIDENFKKGLNGFHAPIVDIGTPNNKKGLETLKNIVDNHDNADYLTIHLHNGKEPEYNTLLENVSELNEYSKEKNITLCIENLRNGFSSKPENIINVAEETGCRITFDIGHTPYENRINCIDLFSDKIYNVHTYEKECDKIGHVAPKDLTNLKPVLDGLLDVGCDFWLIELMNVEEIISTKNMLNKYLEFHK